MIKVIRTPLETQQGFFLIDLDTVAVWLLLLLLLFHFFRSERTFQLELIRFSAPLGKSLFALRFTQKTC